jgi:hypothetical protein
LEKAAFRKVKKIKGLSGGVTLYVAQSNPRIVRFFYCAESLQIYTTSLPGVCRGESRREDL